VAVELEVRVANVSETAMALRREAARLQRRIVSAADGVLQRVYLPKLKELTPAYVPSGYAPVLAKDLKVRTSATFTGNAGVSARISAPTGGPSGRAVAALERGLLSHPLFGNKGHWFQQRVKAGLAKGALKVVKGKIVAGLDREIDKVIADIVRG
jgi:hypothetical protein